MTTTRNRRKKPVTELRMRETELQILLHAATTKRPFTQRQAGYRWGAYADRDPATAYRALSRLMQRGYLEARPVRPRLGAASPKCYLVTPAGAAMYNLAAATPRFIYWDTSRLDEALQYSEMMLERESEGWKFIPRDHAHRFIIGAALAKLKARALTDTERHVQELLSRARPVKLPFDALAHGPTRIVRMIIEARKGLSVGRLLKLLPPLGLAGRLDFELVGTEHERLEGVERLLKTGDWNRQHLPVTVHRVPHMLKRDDPNTATSLREKRFA